MDSLIPYLLLDLAVVAAVIIVMARRMAFWHPLSAYLLFHLYSFTYRLFKITGGSPLMYTGQTNAEVITPEEVSRAMLWADISLLCFVAASWWAHRVFEVRSQEPVERKILNPNIAKFIGILCLPVGSYVFFSLKTSSLTLASDSATTGYIQTMAMWPIGVIGLLIFTFGFRSYLVLLAGFFLGVVALQGYHRFMLILPLIFLTAVYLQSRRRRWPTLLIMLGAIFVGLVFPRLKYIGQALQYGDTNEAASQFSKLSSRTANRIPRVMSAKTSLTSSPAAYPSPTATTENSGARLTWPSSPSRFLARGGRTSPAWPTTFRKSRHRDDVTTSKVGLSPISGKLI